jgi:hypothetical protein
VPAKIVPVFQSLEFNWLAIQIIAKNSNIPSKRKAVALPRENNGL